MEEQKKLDKLNGNSSMIYNLGILDHKFNNQNEGLRFSNKRDSLKTTDQKNDSKEMLNLKRINEKMEFHIRNSEKNDVD